MPAASLQLADAIVAELASGQFAPAFMPVRKLLPVRELHEFDDLRVTVIPRTLESAALGRATEQKTYVIDIGVQQRVPQAADIEQHAADIMAVAETIAEYLRNRPLAALPTAAYVSHGIDPIYSPEHLEELRLATSVINVRYTIRA